MIIQNITINRNHSKNPHREDAVLLREYELDELNVVQKIR